MLVLKQGNGTFTECDIHSNTHSNVVVQKGSAPEFVKCQIRDSKEARVG